MPKQHLKQAAEILKWYLNGCPTPPPHNIKQKVLKQFATKYRLKTFVETGTHSGAMVAAMRGSFDTIYSIELNQAFYNSAKKWFQNDASIQLICGDSGVELGPVVEGLSGPALFWLDGHYSAGKTSRADRDTPIVAELDHIYTNTEFQHVVVIDDARLFGTDPAYPSVSELREQLEMKGIKFDLSIKYDAIRITPPGK